MITETYRGRKLTARKGREYGTVVVTCGGEPVSWPMTTDPASGLAGVRATIDFVDREPFVNGDRWGACWYAPGTYEMCQEGIHPQDIGGPCRHSTCVEHVDDAAERHDHEMFGDPEAEPDWATAGYDPAAR